MRFSVAAALGLLALPVLAVASPLDVVTQHNDNARTGANLNETFLTTQNVAGARFGKLFTRAVNGSLYAQPLYLSGVTLPSGTHNVVYLASTHNVVYCFDADDPAASSPLWSVALEPPASLPDGNIGSTCGVYKNIATEIGIIATPVIDAARQLIFVVTFSRTGSGGSATYSHHLHALSILDGSEQLGGPVLLSASVPGTGTGSIAGSIAFQSQYENQRAALLLSNGQIYIAFASYCDSGPYHGWLLAYDATSLAQTAAYNNTADGNEGGIWQSGEGPSADGAGKIYVSAGNGTFNYSTGGISLGEGFSRLSASLTVEDYFVPFNFVVLNAGDIDIGSTGLLLLPDSTLMLGGSKGGQLYLTDRTNLGQFNASDDSQIAQKISLSAGIYGSPVYWSGPDGPTVYIWGQNDPLKAFHFDGSQLVTPPSSQNSSVALPKMPGGILSVSANGSTASSGVLWSNMTINAGANEGVVPGVLRAFDASDVNVQLWSSEDNAARDSLGNFGKFSSPTVTNGKVYLSTFSNQLVVYGLLPSGVSLAAVPSPAPFAQPVAVTATVLGPQRGMPTGQVTFLDGTTVLGSAPLDTSGVGTWSGPLGVGVHSLTASYPGDGNFAAVTSAVLSEEVLRAPSSVMVSVTPNTLVFGAQARFDFGVRSVGATPTGTVTLSDGATLLGQAMLDGNARASLMASVGAAGSHTLTADYSGDGSCLPASSPLVMLVNRGDSAVTLAAAPLGDAWVLTASVGDGSTAAPTGSVSFLDGSSVLGSASLDGAGVASQSVSLAGGWHALTAEYAGDGDLNGSQSSPLLVDVPTAAVDAGPLDAATPTPPDAASAPADLSPGPLMVTGGCACAIDSGDRSGGNGNLPLLALLAVGLLPLARRTRRRATIDPS